MKSDKGTPEKKLLSGISIAVFTTESRLLRMVLILDIKNLLNLSASSDTEVWSGNAQLFFPKKEFMSLNSLAWSPAHFSTAP